MMNVSFPGGVAVEARFGNHSVLTDQPAPLGGDAAMSPFDLFLASIATCMGFYALRFCQERGISTEGIRIVQTPIANPLTGMINEIKLEIQVPPDFPEKYYASLVKSAELCAVKKHLQDPPSFNIVTKMVEA